MRLEPEYLPQLNPEDEQPLWMKQGACYGYAREAGSYDLFFEEENQKEAKKVCADCPVKFECLDYACKYGLKYGVWGGFSEAMRKRLRGRMKRNNTTLRDELAVEEAKKYKRPRKRTRKGTYQKETSGQ